MKQETIAAIATGMTNSGIGIIRISGPLAIQSADLIFCAAKNNFHLSQAESHTIHYGFIKDHEEIIDEVMVSLMKSPRSFTTEDTVEINCHGGVLVMNRILELLLKNGVRLAEPGEFTKRAFLNGRIDLSRAEAIMDLISSQNETALKNSVHQLRGSMEEKIKSLRAIILHEIAFIESALDDPEHISMDGYPKTLESILQPVVSDVEKLLSTADQGKMMKEGIQTAIIGKPNAGKSSLLNLLVGEDRAIVTDIAGTTRDALEETIRLRGLTLRVIDTAGIRETDDTVEKIGVEKAKKMAEEADLIIDVMDASMPLDDNDLAILQLIRHKKAIILLNKSDLTAVIQEKDIYDRVGDSFAVIQTSTIDQTGIDQLEETIEKLFLSGEIQDNQELIVTNVRHKEALHQALISLQLVLKSIADDMPEDFYSIDLMSAYASLGEIIGAEVSDDLVNEIFSKFCMGK